MPSDLVYDEQLRAAAFDHLTRLLDDSPDGSLASADFNRFQFQGRTVPLVVQTGIWKPAVLDAALSIRTTYTPPSQLPPYADDIGNDGLLRYKWRGTDAQHSDNRALRVAMQRGAPLVYSSVSTAASTSRGTRCGWSKRPSGAGSSPWPSTSVSGSRTWTRWPRHNGSTSDG